MKEEIAEEAQLRRGCKNLVGASTMVYLDDESYMRQRIILTVGAEWNSWHTT